MTSKRTIIVSLIIFFSLLFTGLAALSCFFLFVPGYIESEILPSISKDTGIEISSLKVRSVGLRGAEISDVKLGPNNNEGLVIDSIRLDYSISGLLDRKLEGVALSGISVTLEYKDNQVSVKGLDALMTNQEPDTKSGSDKSKPFRVNKISITNSVLSLNVNEKGLRVPFDLTATAFDQYHLPDKFMLEIFPGDNRAVIEGNITGNNDILLKLTSHALSLKMFEDVINEIAPLNIKGQADIEVSAKLSQDPISITDISASCSLEKTTVEYPGAAVRNPVNPDKSEQPITIQAESKDLEHWEYNVSQTLLDTETFPIILELSGTAEISGEAMKGNIKAVTGFITGSDQFEMIWSIAGEGLKDSDYYKVVINGRTETTGDKALPAKVHFDDMLYIAFSPEVNIQSEYRNGAISGSYIVSLKNIESAYNEMNISMPILSIEGNVDQSEGSKEKFVSIFSVEGKDIVYTGFDVIMNIPDYRIKGSMQYDMKEFINAGAMISFKNGRLSMAENSLNVNKISADIPLHLPLSEKSQKGKLSIEKIKYEDYSLGPVNIDISQEGGNVPFSGNVIFPALPDMAVNISGNAAIEPVPGEGKIIIDVPAYTPKSRIDLGKFLPDLKGFYYRGNLKGSADVGFSDSGLQSQLNLEIDNGTIENSENDLSLENIRLSLRLEDLLSMKSPFGQRLKIDKITIGDIKAEDFTLDFKVDGASLLFVEKGSFKWCGGHINIQSFRINPEKEEYDLILFCDRLKLSEILAQFGVANASGGGTVNGKLPIKLSKNKISFEDGFLYSTPGGGGKINITDTEILTKGLNPDSAEYAQMDIAREALKAFEYTWVKMSFATEKNELVLKLQFDGKPENRLPFTYNERVKRFVRVQNIAEGSDFEGISLDVNFRVPIDRVLNIKDVLDMME